MTPPSRSWWRMAQQGGPDQVREVGERDPGPRRRTGPHRRMANPRGSGAVVSAAEEASGWVAPRGDVDEMAGALMNAPSRPSPSAAPRRRPDTRSLTQRRGDALVDVFDLALNSPDLPTHAGERVHVTVTIRTDVLKSAMGRACLDLTGEISAWEARIWACDCTLIRPAWTPTAKSSSWAGARRLISPGQRRALYLRDRGCAFPGCNRPPRTVTATTSWPGPRRPHRPNNLVLLCAHHHRKVHRTGWDVRIAPDGLPEFVPPTGWTRADNPGATPCTHPSRSNVLRPGARS